MQECCGNDLSSNLSFHPGLRNNHWPVAVNRLVGSAINITHLTIHAKSHIKTKILL